MLMPIWSWLRENPERVFLLLGAIASLAIDYAKRRWPGSARILDILIHLLPNLPASYRALRRPGSRAPQPEQNGLGPATPKDSP